MSTGSDRCQQIVYTGWVTWDQPVGAVEIAKRLGVTRRAVDQWRQRGQFIEPKGEVGGRPAWDWPDVAAWWETWNNRRNS